ncbi:MAG: radical SAM protein, partial [Lachnospiraceae bacterium]
MKQEDFILRKAELLCYGFQTDETVKEQLRKEHEEFFEKGFIDAVNLKLGGHNICANAAEGFSTRSPYTLVYEDGYYMVGNGMREPVSFYPKLPETGTVVDRMARLHARYCINLWPNTACCFDAEGKKCKFCSIAKKQKEPVPVEKVAEGLRILLEKLSASENAPYEINLSGGTYRTPDIMADYWISLVKAIRAFSDCKITVEMAPPADLGKLRELKEAGLTSIIMNLEVANQKLREEICPGKAKIPYEHYYEAFRTAVPLFGWGKVSSVLIEGIQPAEDILAECEKMAEIGVFPSI